jgi:RHS repeat-associated protein
MYRKTKRDVGEFFIWEEQHLYWSSRLGIESTEQSIRDVVSTSELSNEVILAHEKWGTEWLTKLTEQYTAAGKDLTQTFYESWGDNWEYRRNLTNMMAQGNHYDDGFLLWRVANESAPILLGKKQYELSNHLGNVLAVVSDKKIYDATSGWAAQVLTAQDYYPFGMTMGGRSFTPEGYKYGFNGQEKDVELGAYTAEFWEYSANIGRRWNLDPVVSPWESQYAVFYNSPIAINDPNGDDPGKKGSSVQVNKNARKDFDKAMKDPAFKKRMLELEAEYDKQKKTIEIQKGTTQHPSLADGGTVQGTPDGKEGNPNKDFLMYSAIGELNTKIFRIQYYEPVNITLLPAAQDEQKQTGRWLGLLSTAMSKSLFDYWTLHYESRLSIEEKKGDFNSYINSIANETDRDRAKLTVLCTSKGIADCQQFGGITTVFAMSKIIYVKVPKGFWGYNWSKKVKVGEDEIRKNENSPIIPLKKFIFNEKNEAEISKIFSN